jgi:hypothetical protein
LGIVSELLLVGALELALEQPVEFSILGGLLAVWYGNGVRRVPRLLNKYLSESNHFGVVIERLREIDHGIAGILLFARSSSSE